MNHMFAAILPHTPKAYYRVALMHFFFIMGVLFSSWAIRIPDVYKRQDEDGDTPLPIPGGRWLKEVNVGSHLLNYDSMLVLTHFKGHAMGGFGGSLKNISIGCASGKTGKNQIHQIAPDGNWPCLLYTSYCRI